MCGRYARFTPVDVYGQLFGAEANFDLDPSYNVAPSQGVLVARGKPDGGRELVTLHWGLIPFWAKEKKTGYSMINARAESVSSKPSFRQAFRQRRCLIAADGFYEWKRLARSKQPYYINLKNEQPFAFAGLWEHWEGEGEVIESCAIIVTDANELLSDIHNRMPVILAPEDYALWLDPHEQDPNELQPLLTPYSADQMEAYPVSTRVNSPRNDYPDLLERSKDVPSK